MKKAKSSYILETRGTDSEGERLERQSRMKAFDFRPELQSLQIQPGQKLLDAGSGSGIVSDHLAGLAPGVDVTGWDFSADRVAAAQARYGRPGLVFEQKNLLEVGLEDAASGRFDHVVCRLVLRHFKEADGARVVRNLATLLKPGGTLTCIDIDGVPAELYPVSAFLQKAVRKLRDSKRVDFHAAMKLPKLLIDSGLETVDWQVQTVLFKGDELRAEVENLRQSVEHAAAFVRAELGGSAGKARFEREFFGALLEPGRVVFYNKVIAFGTKPKPRLQIAPSLTNR